MLKNEEPKKTSNVDEPHFHCYKCWGKYFLVDDNGNPICEKCFNNDRILCTYIICGSS